VQKPTQAFKSVKDPGNTFEVGKNFSNAPQAHSRVSNINFDIWICGDPMHIPCKFTEGRQNSLPFGV
jgi:hypothetical protein